MHKKFTLLYAVERLAHAARMQLGGLLRADFVPFDPCRCRCCEGTDESLRLALTQLLQAEGVFVFHVVGRAAGSQVVPHSELIQN